MAQSPVMKRHAQSFWPRQFRQWHWVSSALVLALMLLFSITGLTLNNPDWFAGTPQIEEREIAVSADLQTALQNMADAERLDDALVARLAQETGLPLARANSIEFEYGEVIFSLDGPGVAATFVLDTATGTSTYERIDNGLIARLNDLHKGRDTGIVWGLLIDLTAIACIIFCISGLGLLALNAKARSSTWPLASLGVVVPLIAYILFVHR